MGTELSLGSRVQQEGNCLGAADSLPCLCRAGLNNRLNSAILGGDPPDSVGIAVFAAVAGAVLLLLVLGYCW
jgi:hypothetical protein